MTEIETEYRASYFELMQQRLHLEVWARGGASNLFLNEFIGYASIPLMDVANGCFKQAVPVMPVGDGEAPRAMATLAFNIFFEEVWDFYIMFMDWKTTSLEKPKEKSLQLNPQVEVRLLSKQAVQATTHSQVLKNTKVPHWAMFDEGLRYRGTYNDLRNEKLLINVWNSHLLGSSLIGTKTVPLKHCLDMNFLKTELVIHKPKKRTEENIRDKALTCGLQGTLRVGVRPRFQQTGDVDVVAKSEQYLVVQLQRLAVFDSMDDAGGDVTCFASIEWAGAVKKSRGVRKPNMNETLLFHMPIEEDVKRDPARLAEYLNDELETKSELVINVWADTGKATLENLGCGRICLQQLHFQKFEDKHFTDERTKQKIGFQCRVYSTTLKLQSAFVDTSNSQVNLSVWFQPEVPYPSVDLGRLRAKEEDAYPSEEIEAGLKKGEFTSRFNQVLARNFPPEYPVDERRFDNLYFSDQYKQKHLLPLFLSKITPPDSNLINFVQVKGANAEKAEASEEEAEPHAMELVRGIRTLSEVAHFVRCVAFKNQDYQRDRIWSSPDFVLTLRLGSVEEHALLLASMFRAVKYETTADIHREFADKLGGGTGDEPTPPKRKRRRGKKDEEDEDSTISDRVFVCLGRLKDSGLNHTWVMTLSRGYDEVTFWEPSQARRYELPGRIQETEANFLQGYLTPNISEEEKQEVLAHRELRRQESSWFA